MSSKVAVSLAVLAMVVATLACGGAPSVLPSVDPTATMTYEESMATQYWGTEQAVELTQVVEATANYIPPMATQAPANFRLFIVSNGIWADKDDNGWTNYTATLGITNLSSTGSQFSIVSAAVETKTGENYPAYVTLANETFAPIPAGMSVVPVCSHGTCGDNYGSFTSYVNFKVPSTLEPVKLTIVTSSGDQAIDFIKDVLGLPSLNQSLSVAGGVPYTITNEYVTMTIDSVAFSDGDEAQFVHVKFTVTNSDNAANHYSPVDFIFAVADGIWMDDSDFYSGMTNTVVEVGPLETKTVEIVFDIPKQFLSYSKIYMVGLKMKPDSQYEYGNEPPIVIKLK